MKPLKLKPTSFTPLVDFDPSAGKLLLGGYSRPEDVNEFFSPLLDWTEEFVDKITNGQLQLDDGSLPVELIMKFTYFNSSSTKFISDILYHVTKLYHQDIDLKIVWMYEEYDEDMKEVGEDLSDMVGVPFEYDTFVAQ